MKSQIQGYLDFLFFTFDEFTENLLRRRSGWI